MISLLLWEHAAAGCPGEFKVRLVDTMRFNITLCFRKTPDTRKSGAGGGFDNDTLGFIMKQTQIAVKGSLADGKIGQSAHRLEGRKIGGAKGFPFDF